MAGFEKLKAELAAAGTSVVAASVDPLDKAQIVAAEVSFPVAYGVTRAQADSMGSWWEERRSIVQPSEFIIGAAGNVLTSSYSSGPIGRIEAADVIRMINFIESQKK